jgi:L-histidine N-alpha-methyltransferase
LTTAPTATTPHEATLNAALAGLTAPQKTLPPWLFYDERGSRLFEQITTLPEYYLTRTERSLIAAHAGEILLDLGAAVTIVELGAGTATKTGLLLDAATRFQPHVLYQPIDVSPSALAAAATTLTGITVHPQVANYITDPYTLQRPDSPEQGGHHRILALYIGSSIGNFSPPEATSILSNLRHHLEPGDALLLGVDLAPSPHKSVATLLAAYDDAAGVTAAFNKNILTRLNRELAANFDLDAFAHRARWNAAESRIEMHLESLHPQTVTISTGGEAHPIHFAQGETIHTENSYKFTAATTDALLANSSFTPTRTFHDSTQTFALILATALS